MSNRFHNSVDAHIRSVLESGLWFSERSDTLKVELLKLAKHQSFDHGQELFRRGDDCSGLYVVVKGMIKVSGLNASGKEAILTFVDAPNWFGEIAVFDGNERTHDAHAEGETEVLLMPQSGLSKLLEAHPEYWRDLGCLLTSKLRLAFSGLEDLALLPAPVRLGRRLVMIAQGYGEVLEDSLKPVSIPQEQLGNMLSISRQTTNQILKEFQKLGFVDVSYGAIKIADLHGLRVFCELNA